MMFEFLSPVDILALKSVVLKLVLLFVAVEIAMMYLRRFDNRIGTVWKDDIAPLFERSPLAAAVYYGLRFFAVFDGLARIVS